MFSVPDEVFRAADQAAEGLGVTRSQLYTRAVREFLADQGEDPVTLPNTGKALIDSGRWEW